jgi:cytochrome c peroxidase
MPLRLPLCPIAVFVCAVSLNTPLAAEPSVTIGQGAASQQVDVRLTDTSNGAWRLQTSTDLNNWQDRATFKVRNSAHTFQVDRAASVARGDFFRFVSADEAEIPNGRAAATTLPATPENYRVLNLPAHLRAPAIQGQDNTPATNPVTDAGAALGRVLFYDKRLSANNTVACASCHQAEHGFSDPAPLSTGFAGGLTGRNSMGLTSARYYLRRSFFWDERAATLEDQVLLPIQNEVEMGMTLPDLVAKLSEEDYYAELFTAAFGDAAITSDRIARSLAQFVRSIVSSNSKYDAGVPTNFTNFTAEEALGRQIFNGPAGNCTACHGTDNFVPGNTVNNIGLEILSVDRGVGAITGNPADDGKFKVPSLRNIELTAPYMHDGRFATLEEVVEFYNSGVQAHPNLSAPLRNPPGSPGAGQPRRLNLTTVQKAALVAFLKTLTDRTVTSDPRFSDPFRGTDTLVLE